MIIKLLRKFLQQLSLKMTQIRKQIMLRNSCFIQYGLRKQPSWYLMLIIVNSEHSFMSRKELDYKIYNKHTLWKYVDRNNGFLWNSIICLDLKLKNLVYFQLFQTAIFFYRTFCQVHFFPPSVLFFSTCMASFHNLWLREKLLLCLMLCLFFWGFF